MVAAMEGKDTRETYGLLQELERLSEESDALYPWVDRFAALAERGRGGARVRGFRLLCKQARWDDEGAVDRVLDGALSILQEERPTAVRQALAALGDLVPYKPVLWPLVRRRVLEIDPLRYRDTMRPLLERDIRELLEKMT